VNQKKFHNKNLFIEITSYKLHKFSRTRKISVTF